MRLHYRPELDGLRGIAVSIVVLYHAFKNLFPLGLLGVDIFFVLSGYLIAHAVSDKLEDGSFRWKEFYARRIRRIFPALFFLLFISLVTGIIFLPFEKLAGLVRSVISGSFLFANVDLFLFLKDLRNGIQGWSPLLHLWTISIEEQVYLVLPFFLFWMNKIRSTFTGLLILTAASFTGYVMLMKNSPDEVLFFTHLRFWEFSAGSLLAFIPWKRPVRFLQYPALIFVLGICFFPTELLRSYFVSVATVISTSILILSPADSFVHRKVLSGKIFVTAGLCSYSVYLWHVPLFAFGTFFNGGPLSWPLTLTLVISAYVIGYFSWKFIEQPGRQSHVTLPWAAGVILLGVAGLAVKYLL